MSTQARLIVCCLLVVIATCMIGVVIGHRGGESDRLEAEAVLTKAKAEFEKVKNQLPEELIGLIEVSLFLVFLLTSGTIAVFAYFMHRILQQQNNQKIILQVTRAESNLQFSNHEHYRVMKRKTDDLMLENEVRYSAKRREEEP